MRVFLRILLIVIVAIIGLLSSSAFFGLLWDEYLRSSINNPFIFDYLLMIPFSLMVLSYPTILYNLRFIRLIKLNFKLNASDNRQIGSALLIFNIIFSLIFISMAFLLYAELIKSNFSNSSAIIISYIFVIIFLFVGLAILWDIIVFKKIIIPKLHLQNEVKNEKKLKKKLDGFTFFFLVIIVIVMLIMNYINKPVYENIVYEIKDDITVSSRNYYIEGNDNIYYFEKYYPDGVLSFECKVENSHLKGIRKRYYKNGFRKEYCEIKDSCELNVNYPDGLYSSFYTNGNIEASYTVSGDGVAGRVTTYDSLGNIYEAYNIENGMTNGTYTIYYPNGKVHFIHNYVNDTLQGKFHERAVDSLGEKLIYGFMHKGEKDSLWKIYTEDNVIFQERGLQDLEWKHI